MKELIRIFRADLLSTIFILLNVVFVIVEAFSGVFLWLNFMVAVFLAVGAYYTSDERSR